MRAQTKLGAEPHAFRLWVGPPRTVHHRPAPLCRHAVLAYRGASCAPFVIAKRPTREPYPSLALRSSLAALRAYVAPRRLGANSCLPSAGYEPAGCCQGSLKPRARRGHSRLAAHVPCLHGPIGILHPTEFPAVVVIVDAVNQTRVGSRQRGLWGWQAVSVSCPWTCISTPSPLRQRDPNPVALPPHLDARDRS